MTSYAIIAILIAAICYLVYKLYSLTQSVKSIRTVSIEIWAVETFTTDDEDNLATHREALRLVSKLISYRISRISEKLTDVSASDIEIRSTQRTVAAMLELRNMIQRLYNRQK